MSSIAKVHRYNGSGLSLPMTFIKILSERWASLPYVHIFVAYQTGFNIMIVLQQVAGSCSLQNKSGGFDLKLKYVSGPK